MNATYTFMYLFVVYFSFAPVISTNIHRYVNYFVILVLMMVTETETFTSTLHHNIFPYLDYVFFCYLHTVGFQSIFTFIYVYIKIYSFRILSLLLMLDVILCLFVWLVGFTPCQPLLDYLS